MGRCRLGIELLRPGCLPGDGHFRLLGDLDSGSIGGSLDDTLPSDDVFPTLAHVHLLGRGHGPLNFRCDRVACDGALRCCSGACFARAAFVSFHLIQPQ